MSDQPLLLAASVEVQAAGGDRPPRVSILAYSGDVMRPPGWGDVAIELSGIQLSDQVPLLLDHQNAVAAVAGHGTPSVRDGRLTIDGTLSRATDAGKLVLSLSAEGTRLGASVGLEASQRERVRPGDMTTVNGRAVKAGPAGLTIVRSGALREVSITPVPADPSTTVAVAASKGTPMTTDTPTTPTPDDEAVRTGRLNAIFSGGDWSGVEDEAERLRAAAIADGRLPSDLTDDLDRLRQLQATRLSRPTHVSGGSGRSSTTPTREALEASLLLRAAGEAAAVKAYGERTVETARNLRCNSLVDLAAAALRLVGQDVPHSRDELLRASVSAASLPTILSNVMGRSLVEAYTEATSNWRSFATVKSAADFRPQSAIRPSSIEAIEEVAPGGEIKHGTLLEEGVFPWRIGTFGKMLGIDRRDLINDDLQFFSDVPQMLGTSAARALNDLLWSTILANAGDFFHADNGNLLTTSSALAVETLGAAVSAMRSQRDSRGTDLQITPVALAVPPGLELTSRTLLNSAELITGDGGTMPSGNPVSGIVPNLVVESRLANTDRFSGASATAWYLFASPASNAVIVGFLGGVQAPTVQTQGADFHRLGIQLRVFHDFGVALGDPRGALKATGASG